MLWNEVNLSKKKNIFYHSPLSSMSKGWIGIFICKMF